MTMNQQPSYESSQKVVWPVPSIYGIKVTEFLKHNLNYKLHEQYMAKSNIQVPPELIAYIFQCSELLEVETLVHFHTIHLFHFFLERNPKQICYEYKLFKTKMKIIKNFTANWIMICNYYAQLVYFYHQRQILLKILAIKQYSIPNLKQKLFEKCQICADNIIYLSNYSYTKQVLSSFDFQITLRDELLIDRIMIFLRLIEPLIPPDTINKYIQLSISITESLYEDFLFIKNFPDINLLAASSMNIVKENYLKLFFQKTVIQCATVLLTHHSGQTPIVLRLSNLIKLSQQNICEQSHQIFKRILKKKFMKRFSF